MLNDVIGFHHAHDNEHINKIKIDTKTENIDEMIGINQLGRNILIMSYVLERSIVSLWSSFERYFYDICFHIFKNRPEILKSNSITLSTEELINKRNYKNIIDAIIQKALFKLSSEGFFAYEHFFKKRSNIDFNIELNNHYAKLDLMRLRRNEIIHHDGILTRENHDKLGFQADKIGSKMLISLPYFCESALRVLESSMIIDIKVVEKFGPKFWLTESSSETAFQSENVR